MQFNTHATNQDLVSEINSICSSDATSYPIADKTRRVNSALEELVAEIINADGTWEYDDTNHTDLPVGTGTLQDGVSQYAFTSEYLQVKQVQVKDASGNWNVLKQIDYADFKDIAIEEYFEGSGMPTHYDIIADTIRLYPAPATASVTLTAGLRVKFSRTIDLFTTTDTTQEPGIPSPYHVLVAQMASLPYCAIFHPERAAYLERKIMEGKASLIRFFSKRNKDNPPVMTMRPITFR